MAKKKTTRKPKPKSKKVSEKEVPFEESLEELREVVNQLENGNLTLSQSLEEYEQGVSNLKSCYDALNRAQRKIEMLVELDEEGNLVTRPFDNTASTEKVAGSRRAVSSANSETDEEDLENEDEDEYEEDSDDELDIDDSSTLF
ncbi:MAG: exodeoxyribonuclease VII small subunit [Mariniblastus sp.]